MVVVRDFLREFDEELDEQCLLPLASDAVMDPSLLEREVTTRMIRGGCRAVANYLRRTTESKVAPFRLSKGEITGRRIAMALIGAYESWRRRDDRRLFYKSGSLQEVCRAFVSGLLTPPRLEKPPIRRLQKRERTPTPAEARGLWTKIQGVMDRDADARAFYQKTMDDHSGDPNFPELFHGGIVLWMWHSGSEDLSSAKLRTAMELALQGYQMERAGALEERTLH